MSKIGKKVGGFIFRLVVFATFTSWFVFVIWGIKNWGQTTSFVSEKTTIVLLSLPLIIGMFILFLIVSFIGAITSRREEKKKKEDKVIKIGALEGEDIEIKVPKDLDWLPKELREGIGKFIATAGKEIQIKSSDDSDKIPKEIKDFFAKFKEKKD